MIGTRQFGSLHMGWEHVLFANWTVDPTVVEPHLPERLTVDTYEGDAYLSVVPFRNVDVRPTWLPDGVGLPLPELNLRTYVRLEDDTSLPDNVSTPDDGSLPDNVSTPDDTSMPDNASTPDDGPTPDEAGAPWMEPEAGVYFFSLDADGILGVSGARLFHSLPYYLADIDLRERNGEVRFESRRRHPGARAASFAADYGPTGGSFTAESGSLASFLTDRARYFTEAPDGELRYATVSHERWPLYEASVEIHRNDMFAANGFERPETEPRHLYSPRVTTTASDSRPVSELS